VSGTDDGDHRWRLACSLVALAAVTGGAVGCSPAESAQDGESTTSLLYFDRAQLLEEEGATSANVSVGDVNGDGHLDILLVKGRHWPLLDLLLAGDGTGAFAQARPIADAADRSYSGVLIDIDGDRDLDVVISNDTPDSKVVHLNDGRGTFTVGSTFGRPEWPTRHVKVADLDGDALPDLVLANRTGDDSGFNYVCMNRGGGRFDGDCLGFSRESATTVTPADVDGDGHLDLAVPHREGGQSYVYLNGGDASFARRVPFGPPDAAIRSAETADVNGDGVLDLVVIDERKGPAIYLGGTGGTFGAGTPLGEPGRTPYALAVADLNRDGRDDVLVGYVNARPVVHFGNGAGDFQEVPFGDDQGVAYGFAAGDVNEDGHLDIAMARSDAPNVLYFGSPQRDPQVASGAAPDPFAPTSDSLEQRDLPVDGQDLAILLRATELLTDPAAWNRADDRLCEDDEAAERRSLFCALQSATTSVLGSYHHRRAALQEVRFAVEEATAGRQFEHRLMDLNNLPETTLEDVRSVLRVATERVRARMRGSDGGP
jgi:hypothetical protein